MPMLLDKFLSQTVFESYQDFISGFNIQVPENFNFAYDVVDVIASGEPDKIAMVWCNDKGGGSGIYLWPDENSE